MRKTILYIIISLLILPGLTSCNKWLDVQPQNSVSEDNLFNSKEGFRNALNGIYLSLAEPSLYGAELTYATMSALSYNYRITSGTYLTTMQFDYEHSQVRPRLDKFWEGLYNAIANCNNLLVNIENKNAEDFIDGLQEKNLIKGEALALRGFLHFELLRLYAPSIAVDAQGRYIPYYTTYPSHGETKISSMEVLNRAAEDLKLGRDLVAPYDTITAGYSAFASPEARLSNNYNGAFYSRRGTRLNYFAITGILARLYLYANDKTNALKYAQEIVPYTINTTPLKYYFYFTPESALNLNVAEARNRRLTHDIILGFYNRLTLDNFENTIGKSAGVFISDAANLFVPDLDDFRFSRLTEGSGANLISIKYKRGGNTYNMDNTVGRIIPILRLSEIYYILGECLIDTDPAQAVNYLNLVRKGRGINGNPLSTPISKQSYMDALVRDARKEFIGEGQLFFMYKRLNIPAIGNNGLGVEMGEKFVLPIPVSENNF